MYQVGPGGAAGWRNNPAMMKMSSYTAAETRVHGGGGTMPTRDPYTNRRRDGRRHRETNKSKITPEL